MLRAAPVWQQWCLVAPCKMRLTADLHADPGLLLALLIAGITNLPGGITRLRNLECLDVSGCPLTFLPSQLWRLAALRHVRLNNTCLAVGLQHAWEPLARLPALESLELRSVGHGDGWLWWYGTPVAAAGGGGSWPVACGHAAAPGAMIVCWIWELLLPILCWSAPVPLILRRKEAGSFQHSAYLVPPQLDNMSACCMLDVWTFCVGRGWATSCCFCEGFVQLVVVMPLLPCAGVRRRPMLACCCHAPPRFVQGNQGGFAAAHADGPDGADQPGPE